MKQHAKIKKDFEAARLGVFAIPGLLLTQLDCGIQVESSGNDNHGTPALHAGSVFIRGGAKFTIC